MKKISFLFLFMLTFVSCTQQSERGAGVEPPTSEPPEVVDTGPSAAEICESEIKLYSVEISSYNNRKFEHDRVCNDLNNQQTEINLDFSNLQSEWPIAFSYIKSCIRKDSIQSCIDQVCIAGIITGSANCNELIVDLKRLGQRHEAVYSSAKENGCGVNVQSELARWFNQPDPRPIESFPDPPQAPSCYEDAGMAAETPAAR